ncbi:MAG: MBOAT family O-acyltransferase [Candidatus Peregrinibacteria bacterium]|nr:MBOAT family O-acyltransferase [Candidatus Peregrinibacteria bacterium]
MQYASLTFWVSFLLFLGLYAAVHRHVRLRNILLLAFSYLLYVVWDGRFLLLLILATLVSYVAGRALEKSHYRRTILWSAIIFHLIILGFFKYAGFFVSSFQDVLALFGLPWDWAIIAIALPLGISFYTFQLIGYVVDVYRGTIRANTNLLDLALFAAFFPKLLAGPIERAGHLLPQFSQVRPITKERLSQGIILIAWGFVQKFCIADNAALIADTLFDHSLLTPHGLSGALAVSLEIYADFSGYSDVAKGIAALLGFDLVWNFRMPYVASTPSDFWKRWHISLSEWFRDYVYIPLGGSRGDILYTIQNLFVTMLLVGLWHGAQWTFVLWGMYHGFLATAYAVGGKIIRIPERIAHALPFRILATVFFFGLVTFGWILFASPSLDAFAQAILGMRFSLHELNLPLVLLLWAPIILMHFLQGWKGDLLAITRLPTAVQCIFVLACIYALILFSPQETQQFLYVRF